MLPDLSERIAWYQDRLRPEDDAFGNGIADWKITSEYRDNFTVDGSKIWGMMCSPSLLPELKKLQPADIEAKRAHIIVRTLKNAAELPEIERTLLHELGHVLVAPMQSANREAEENAMHSLDHFFSKLSPEQGQILARSFQNPMARAYRAPAKEGDMPDPVDQENKDKPDKEAPKMQEGATRSVEEIQAEMAMVDPADATKLGALAVELRNALIKKGIDAQAGAAPASVAPPAPPTMGMKPEEAYQRKVKAEAQAETVKAFADMVEGLTDDQRAMVRECSTVDHAKRLVKTYPRQTGATLGMKDNPKTGAKGATDEKPMARAMREAADNPMLRKVLSIGSMENDGMHVEPSEGILVYIDGTERINHQRAAHEARRKEMRGAA